jgi:hypothetical protein
MKLPHEIQQDPKVVPTEDTDFDIDELATLKDEIEKWRRDRGGDE